MDRVRVLDPRTLRALRAAGFSDTHIVELYRQFSELMAAGLDRSEVRFDPQHGVMISEAGVRKLAAANGKTDAEADAAMQTLAERPPGTRH